jgi:hypothetical protein
MSPYDKTRTKVQRATKAAWGAVAALLITSGAALSAQAPQKEEFTAFGVNLDRGRAGVVDIVIEKWSPDGDREALLQAFADKGQDEMLKQLLKRPRLGYIRLPNTMGHDIHYAVQQPMPEGGRRVIVGEGKMSTGTQIMKSKDGTHLELEMWGNTPTRFTEVKSTVKK